MYCTSTLSIHTDSTGSMLLIYVCPAKITVAVRVNYALVLHVHIQCTPSVLTFGT